MGSVIHGLGQLGRYRHACHRGTRGTFRECAEAMAVLLAEAALPTPDYPV